MDSLGITRNAGQLLLDNINTSYNKRQFYFKHLPAGAQGAVAAPTFRRRSRIINRTRGKL